MINGKSPTSDLCLLTSDFCFGTDLDSVAALLLA
jgi:hypothetical protein